MSIFNNFGANNLNNNYWGKNARGQWCSLLKTDFSVLKNSGVYIFFGYDSDNTLVVIKVGQSENLAERIISYKNNDQVLSYSKNPYVTWINLSIKYLDGVERYLGEYYRPLIAERFPDAPVIPINLPF